MNLPFFIVYINYLINLLAKATTVPTNAKPMNIKRIGCATIIVNTSPKYDITAVNSEPISANKALIISTPF